MAAQVAVMLSGVADFNEPGEIAYRVSRSLREGKLDHALLPDLWLLSTP